MQRRQGSLSRVKWRGVLHFFLKGEVMGMMQRQISPLTAFVVVVIVILLVVAVGWFFWFRQPSSPPPSEEAPQPPGLPSATQPERPSVPTR
jgi:cytoskeletal protein RodZ